MNSRLFCGTARVTALLLIGLLFWLPDAVAADAREAGATENFGGITFVWCPPGVYRMGAAREAQDIAAIHGGSAAWYSDELPAREVTIRRGFWMSKHMITQGQWQSLMETRPWSGLDVPDAEDVPATGMPWQACIDFAHRFGQSVDMSGRLPEEAEWEYACKAGQDDYTPEDLSAQGWYRWNSEGRLRPVGGKAPNPWGLHDMLGNAWEWCADPVEGGLHEGVALDTHGIIRGGSAAATAGYVRPSFRLGHLREVPSPFLGFRVVLDE